LLQAVIQVQIDGFDTGPVKSGRCGTDRRHLHPPL